MVAPPLINLIFRQEHLITWGQGVAIIDHLHELIVLLSNQTHSWKFSIILGESITRP